jgi:hypothetical protein
MHDSIDEKQQTLKRLVERALWVSLSRHQKAQRVCQFGTLMNRTLRKSKQFIGAALKVLRI